MADNRSLIRNLTQEDENIGRAREQTSDGGAQLLTPRTNIRALAQTHPSAIKTRDAISRTIDAIDNIIRPTPRSMIRNFTRAKGPTFIESSNITDNVGTIILSNSNNDETQTPQMRGIEETDEAMLIQSLPFPDHLHSVSTTGGHQIGDQLTELKRKHIEKENVILEQEQYTYAELTKRKEEEQNKLQEEEEVKKRREGGRIQREQEMVLQKQREQKHAREREIELESLKEARQQKTNAVGQNAREDRKQSEDKQTKDKRIDEGKPQTQAQNRLLKENQNFALEEKEKEETISAEHPRQGQRLQEENIQEREHDFEDVTDIEAEKKPQEEQQNLRQHLETILLEEEEPLDFITNLQHEGDYTDESNLGYHMEPQTLFPSSQTSITPNSAVDYMQKFLEMNVAKQRYDVQLPFTPPSSPTRQSKTVQQEQTAPTTVNAVNRKRKAAVQKIGGPTKKKKTRSENEPQIPHNIQKKIFAQVSESFQRYQNITRGV